MDSSFFHETAESTDNFAIDQDERSTGRQHTSAQALDKDQVPMSHSSAFFPAEQLGGGRHFHSRG